jgi:hypothetical protein
MTIRSESTLSVLRDLWRSIKASKDKLFFIRHSVGSFQDKWFLVQVDLDETDPQLALQFGRYHCRWYIRHCEDSHKELTRRCRFWPEIHEVQDGVLSTMLAVRPDKVLKFLKSRNDVAWYQLDVDLAEHKLVGPFNFLPKNLVDHTHWDRLVGYDNDVDVSNVDCVDPLR